MPVDFQAESAVVAGRLSIELSASKSPLVIRLPPAPFFWITTSSMIAAPCVNDVKPEKKLSSSSLPRFVSTRKAIRTLPAPALHSASSDFSSALPAGLRLMLVVDVAVAGGAVNGGLVTPPPTALNRLRDRSSIIGANVVGVCEPGWVVWITSENQRRCTS